MQTDVGFFFFHLKTDVRNTFPKKDVRNRFYKQMLEIDRETERIDGQIDTSKDGKTEEKSRRQAEMLMFACLWRGKGVGNDL